jgi:hypothetical protein
MTDPGDNVTLNQWEFIGGLLSGDGYKPAWKVLLGHQTTHQFHQSNNSTTQQ